MASTPSKPRIRRPVGTSKAQQAPLLWEESDAPRWDAKAAWLDGFETIAQVLALPFLPPRFAEQEERPPVLNGFDEHVLQRAGRGRRWGDRGQSKPCASLARNQPKEAGPRGPIAVAQSARLVEHKTGCAPTAAERSTAWVPTAPAHDLLNQGFDSLGCTTALLLHEIGSL